MAKRKSDSDKDDALLPSDILESSPKAKVQCLDTPPYMQQETLMRVRSVPKLAFLSVTDIQTYRGFPVVQNF